MGGVHEGSEAGEGGGCDLVEAAVPPSGEDGGETRGGDIIQPAEPSGEDGGETGGGDMVEPAAPSSGEGGGEALDGGIVELAVPSAEEGGETVGGDGGGSVEVDGGADVTEPNEVNGD